MKIMPRPDPNAPKIGQYALDIPEVTAEARKGEVVRGRHAAAVDRALDAAKQAELIAAVDEAGATFLRAAGTCADAFEAGNMPYGLAKLLPGVTELLRDMHMTPESRETDADAAIRALLDDLSTVEADEPSNDDAAIHHATD